MDFLSNRSLSRSIIDVDSKLSLTSEPISNLTVERAEVADIAAKAFDKMFSEFKKEPLLLDANNVKDLSKMVFDMYMTKLNLHKNGSASGESFSKTAMNIDNCLMKALALLYPEESGSNFKVADIMFEFMLDNIRYDVAEEVIGQERPMGALPRLIDKELLKKGITNTPELKKIAGMLYPLAILASYFDEKANIPKEELREMALNYDVNTFMKEYKSQFLGDCSDIWDGVFFAECMAKIWNSIEKK